MTNLFTTYCNRLMNFAVGAHVGTLKTLPLDWNRESLEIKPYNLELSWLKLKEKRKI